MQHPFITTLVAAAAGCSGLIQAEAASAPPAPQPQVVQGIGPEAAAPIEPQAVRAPYPQPQAYQSAPRQPQPMRMAAAGQGSYGGGFIEMLMTRGGASPSASGGAPAPAPARAPVGAPMARAPAGQVIYARPPPQQQASLAPQASLRRQIDPQYLKQEVAYSGGQGAGNIVIDTPNKFLYLSLGDGRALRYGIGVGRPGFTWAGVKTVSRKAEWPAWTPPDEMLLRRPDLPRHMDGGPENPLGARAMYLGSSLYRIHGTNEPETIGTNVSSGCIRLTNDDVVDLYGRVRVGAKVTVL